MAAELASGLTAGQITLTGGAAAVELGPLIQSAIDPNAVLAPFQVILVADAGNAAPIYFGASSGTNASNYGFSLAAGANQPLGGGGSGNTIPLGRFYAFSASNAALHLMIFP